MKHTTIFRLIFALGICLLFLPAAQAQFQDTSIYIRVFVDGVYAGDGSDPVKVHPDGYDLGFEAVWRLKTKINGLPNCSSSPSGYNCGQPPCVNQCVGENIINYFVDPFLFTNPLNFPFVGWKYGYNTTTLEKVQIGDLPSGTTINLSGNNSLSMDLELTAWESDDCGQWYTYDSGCGAKGDDNYTNGARFVRLRDMKVRSEGGYSTELMPWYNVWAVRYKVVYFIDAIKRNSSGTPDNLQVGFFAGPGNTNFQVSSSFCNGSEVVYMVPLKQGFTGGYYKWDYFNPQSNQWEFDQYTSTNFLKKTINGRVLRYRATTATNVGTDLLASKAPGTVISSAANAQYTIFTLPSADDIVVSPITPACGTNGTRQIEFKVSNQAANATFKAQLYSGAVSSLADLNNSTALWSSAGAISLSNPFTIPVNLTSGAYTIVLRGGTTQTEGCAQLKQVSVGLSSLPTFVAAVTNPPCSYSAGGSVAITYTGISSPNVGTVTYSLLQGTTVVAGPIQRTAVHPSTQGFNYTFTNVAPGNYTIRAVTPIGCTSTQTITVGAKPAALALALQAPPAINGYQVKCVNDFITINATPSGGTTTNSFQYSITRIETAETKLSNGSTTPFSYQGFGVQTLNFQVKDANNCVLDRSIQITAPTASLALYVQSVTPSAPCTPTGSATLDIFGGVAPYQYSLSNTGPWQNSPVFNNLAGGPRTFWLRDAAGCIVSASAVIPAIGAPEISATATDVSCFGNTDGAIALSGSNGTPPYTFALFQGNTQIGTGETYSNLAPGTYRGRITDANNCIAEQEVLIREPLFFEIVDVQQGYSPCSGEPPTISVVYRGRSDGSWFNYPIELSKDGGLSWNGANEWFDDGLLSGTFVTFDPTVPETFEFVLRDPNGCLSNTRTLTITDPGQLTGTLTNVKNVSCEGNSDGALTLEVTNGVPPYTVVLGRYDNASSWLEFAQTDTLLGNPDPATGVATFTFNNLPRSISNAVQDWSGGYVFHVFDQGNILGANSLCFVSVPDRFYFEGDFQPISIDYAPPVSIVDAFSSGEGIGCAGNNGQITVIAADGTQPYYYSLDGVAYQKNNNILSGAGEQNTVYVRDDNGCEALPVQVSIPLDPPTIYADAEVQRNESDCNSGKVRIAIYDGEGPYRIALATSTNAQAVCDGDLSQALVVVSNLSDAEYVFEGLTEGDYTACIQDGEGCTTATSFGIARLAPLQLKVDTVEAVSCFGYTDGKIGVSALGGRPPYILSINNDNLNGGPNTVYDNLAAGNYLLTLEDAEGCVQFLFTEVQVGKTLALINSSTPPLCFNDSTGTITVAPINGNAPYQCFWTHDPGNVFTLQEGEAVTLSGLPTTELFFQVTDAEGCAQTLQGVLIGPGEIGAQFQVQNAACGGVANGSVAVIPTGGIAPFAFSLDSITYQASNIFNGLASGSYRVYIRDGNNCNGSATFSVGTQIDLNMSVLAIGATCSNGSNGIISVQPLNGIEPYTYSLNGVDFQPSANFSNLAPGTYTIYVQDGQGCVGDTTGITVTAPPPIVLSSVQETPISCPGGQNGVFNFNVSGGTPGYQYSLNGGNFTLNKVFPNLAAGVYALTVRDNASCTQTFEVTLDDPDPIQANITFNSIASCNSAVGSASVAPTGGTPGYAFRWNGLPFLNQPNWNNIPPGDHFIQITDSRGCIAIEHFNMAQSPPVAATLNVVPDTCGRSNGSISVNVTAGTPPYNYAWNTGAQGANPVLSDLGPGVYSVTITDLYNCAQTLTATLTEIAGPTLNVLSSADALCVDGTGEIIVNASGGNLPYTYNWSHEPGLNAPVASNLPGGVYTVVVTDAFACSAELSETIGYFPAPTAASAQVLDAGCGQPNGRLAVSVSGGTLPFSYAWSHNAGLNAAIADNLPAGTYTVTVTDAKNCTISLTEIVDDLSAPTLAAGLNASSTCGEANGTLEVTVGSGTAPYTFAWSNNPLYNLPSANNLSAGMYTVTVTDDRNCRDTLTLNLANIAGPAIAALQSTPSLCTDGAGVLSVSLEANTGTEPFSYSWIHDSNENDATAESLFAGTYTVTVTDANGCTAVQSAAVSFVPGAAIDNIAIANSLCVEGNGALTATVTPGPTPYTFVWSHDPGLSSLNLTDLNAGAYTLAISDENGCTDSATVNVLLEASPVFESPNIQNTSCGLSAGIITTTLNGGTPGFTYTWSHNAAVNTPSANGLAEGTYNITVTDLNGCTATTTAEVVNFAAPILETDLVTDANCNQAQGSISVNATGVSALTYSWSHSAAVQQSQASFLTPGIYTVTVSDVNGCTASLSATVANLPGVEATLAASNSICVNGNGALVVIPTGNAAPFVYNWSHNALLADSIAIGLAAGVYSATISDANGCTAVVSTNIAFEAAPDGSVQTSASACNSPTGTVALTVNGGTAPLGFTWSHDPALNTASANSLSAGTYTVTVSDGNGCTFSATATVLPGAGPQGVSTTVADADCGLSNGSISSNIGSGTPPYQYQWSTGQTGAPAINNLSAGIYALTITDGLGCTSTLVQVVSNVTAPVLAPDGVTNAYCDLPNGAAGVQVLSGLPPYIYNWVNANDSQTSISTSSTATNLVAGTYLVQVTDNVGCSRYAQITISGTPGFTLTAVKQDVACAGQSNGSANALVSSGGVAPFTYQWSNNTQVALAGNLAAGLYTVTVNDVLGCTRTANVSINEPAAMTLTATALVRPTCAGSANGELGVVAAGGNANGYTYNWSSGQSASGISNLVAGVYTVTASDQLGCTVTLSIPLTEPAPIMAGFVPAQPLCNGQNNGSLLTTVSGGNGGFSYLWSNGQTTQQALSLTAGNYVLTITDNKGCTASASTALADPPQLIAAASVSVPACGGNAVGQLNANAGGGTGALQYLWSDPFGQITPNAQNLSAGNYTVTVSDANGCTTTAQGSIQLAPAVTAVITAENDVNCVGGADGSALVLAGGGTGAYTYQWNDPAGQTQAQANNLGAGMYQVLVTDAVGCTATTVASIAPGLDFVANITGINGPSCNGLSDGSASVFVVGNPAQFTYTWSDPAAQTLQTAQNLTPGVYSVTVGNANGCTKVLSATVPATPPISVSQGNLLAPSCFNLSNGSAQVLANGGTGAFNYQWSTVPPQTTQTAFSLEAGTYTVTVRDANNCSATFTVNVPGTPQLLAGISTITAPLCAGQSNGSATASGSGGTGAYTWLWSNNGQLTQTANNLLPGTYTVTVSDANNCTATATATIPLTPALILQQTASVSPTCAGLNNGSLSVSGSGGTGTLTYTWNTIPAQSGTTAANLGPGAYIVTLSDQNGCTATSSYTVSPTASIQVSLSSQNTPCATQASGSISASAAGGTAGYTYNWSNGQSGAQLSNLLAGVYTVTVSDQNGCTAVQSAIVGATTPPVNVAVFLNNAPGCAGGDDGAITLSASGGAGGLLNFNWSNGANGFQLANLTAGTYTVTVSDPQGCTSSLSVSVADGPVFSIELGGQDTSICNGDALIFDLPDNSINYAWTGPGGFSATGGNVVLQNSGQYQLTASHPSGCTDTDNINVSIAQEPLAAFFVIATDVVINDTIVAVEVSWPVPGNVAWEYNPQEVQLIGQDLNQYFFKFLRTGPVTLRMRAQVGGCIDYISKTVQVFATQGQLPPLADRSELISFQAVPNPSSGLFNIIAEFEQNTSAVLSLFRSNGQLIERRILENAAVYNQAFDFSGQQPGLYSAVLQISGRKYAITVVIQR